MSAGRRGLALVGWWLLRWNDGQPARQMIPDLQEELERIVKEGA